MYLKPVQYRIL